MKLLYRNLYLIDITYYIKLVTYCIFNSSNIDKKFHFR